MKESMVNPNSEAPLRDAAPRPIRGTDELVVEGFGALPETHAHLFAEADFAVITKAVAASFLKIDHWTVSAWSELVPALFALMAVTRPRRYVELGVHNGMSFFAACQMAEAVSLHTECVAIDSWIGDAHASFHSEKVFTDFREFLRSKYPNQFYIRGLFSEAANCFAAGSIDLLHIDGFHSYEAVKEDFETWLPKMSSVGVVIFHDINVHERGFGVWRYWKEINRKFPSISLYHCHGLGILYVGNSNSSVREIFNFVSSDENYGTLLQQYLEGLGQLSAGFRRAESEAAEPHVGSVRSFGSEFLALTREDELVLRAWQDASNEQAEKTRLKGRGIFGRILGRFRNLKQVRLQQEIRGSGLFDDEYYLSSYPDVRESGMDPVRHYVLVGARELRNPSVDFSTVRYLLNNPDVRSTKLNPLLHYIRFGRYEGRSC